MACVHCSCFFQNEAVRLGMAPGVAPRLIPMFALVANLPESCRNRVRNPMCPLHAGLRAFPADLFALSPAVCVRVRVCVCARMFLLRVHGVCTYQHREQSLWPTEERGHQHTRDERVCARPCSLSRWR